MVMTTEEWLERELAKRPARSPEWITETLKAWGLRRPADDAPERERVCGVISQELDRTKGADSVGFAVDGPTRVPAPKGFARGWVIMVTLKHDVRLDLPDVGVSMPVYGAMPDDDIFRQAVTFLLEKARTERVRLTADD